MTLRLVTLLVLAGLVQAENWNSINGSSSAESWSETADETLGPESSFLTPTATSTWSPTESMMNDAEYASTSSPSSYQSVTTSASSMTSETLDDNSTDVDYGDGNYTDDSLPNEPIPKPDCNSTNAISVRYSATTGRLYLETYDNTTRGGCVTIDQIWEARGGGSKGGAKAPLYAVDADTGDIMENITGTWLLDEDLYVEDGITLKIWGGASGGLCDELRLKSNPLNSSSNSSNFINLRAHGGSLDFENTRVYGWDTTTQSYDEDESDGRSYISAVSEIVLNETETCVGRAKNTMGEARMDIVDSEIAFVGYRDSESYGLTWKVRGFCKNKTNPEVFDSVGVYGNIYDSELHHMNFAVYTYGHQNGDWRRNKVHSNSGYGFDPHDDSDYLNIHDNIVYDNNWHGIIASKRCNNVSIQNNTVYGGNDTSAGIFLHRSSDYAIVKNNHVYSNGDAGMAMLESSNAHIEGNVFEGNKYGIRMSVGCTNNMVYNNTFANTSKYALYTYEGSDGPDVMATGYPQNNTYEGNVVEGGVDAQAIKLKESDGSRVVNNVFIEPGVLEWINSTRNVVTGNTGLEDAVEVKIVESCFDETDEESLADYSCDDF